MEVILLERIGKLGQMGDVVRVKDGFARNFLLPRGKALRATADNKKRFEDMKAELQAKQPRAQGRGRHARQQARRQDLCRPPSGERRPGNCSARFRPVTSPACSRPMAPRSTVRRSCSMHRSRRSANTRCRWRFIRKSRFRSPSRSRAALTKRERIARGEDVTVRRTEAEEEAAAAAAAAEAMFDPEAKAQHDAPDAETASPDTKSDEAPAKPAKAKAKRRRRTRRPDAIPVFSCPRPAWRRRPRARLLWCHSLSVLAPIYPAASALRWPHPASSRRPSPPRFWRPAFSLPRTWLFRHPWSLAWLPALAGRLASIDLR